MPNCTLLDPKTLLFNGFFALFSLLFNSSKRFCLCNCSVFLCFSTCILQHFALRFAPFYLVFCTKMQCVLPQNALHLAAYCSTFSNKLPKKWCRGQFLGIKIHLACIYNLPLFASKQTFARIDFLRQGGRLVSRTGTHNVKILTEKWIKFGLAG